MSERAAPLPFAEAFSALSRASAPDPRAVRAAFDAILEGAWTPVQVGAYAAALRVLGETPEAIVAAAESLRASMAEVVCDARPLVDTCGTGGDGAHTLNVSTAAALVVAACGATVAKHGNRSVSSRCGSADVVEALGIPIDVPPARQAAVLAEAKIAFLFAPAHHPALRHAGQARKELGVRTLFNAVGPLVNPARTTHQLVGVYDDALRPIVARALGLLGVERAWVVRSVDGLDEISPSAPTRVSALGEGGVVEELVVEPKATFGVEPSPLGALAGGSAEENARAIERIARGEPHPAADAVVLNAAAALVVAGVERDARTAAERARAAIASGAAGRTLDVWRSAATRAKAHDDDEGKTK